MATLFLITHFVLGDIRKDVQTIDSWAASSPLVLLSDEEDLQDFECLQ